MKINKKIVDTTLRDGEQCPRVAFQPDDKIALAKLLDQMGVYEIELGVFAKEHESYIVEEIMKQTEQAQISVWSRLVEEDIRDIIALSPDRIHISIPVSYIQIYGKLKKNKDWIKNQLYQCINLIQRNNLMITVGFEDASRADISFCKSMARFIWELGIDTIRIADTVGAFFPSNAKSFVQSILEEAPLCIETHEHNDLGMAVANTISMANAGAQLLDCTLLGIGERAGNCNLRKLICASEHVFDFSIDKQMLREAEEKLMNMIIEK